MLIAEIAQTHDGSLGNALHFIDAVAEAGADAVKFQCHDGDTNNEPPQSRCRLWQDATRRDYWKRTAFDHRGWLMLKARACKNGILFGCTPFSIQAVTRIRDVCDFLKVARGHFDTHLHRAVRIAAEDQGIPCYHTGPKGLGLNEFDPDLHIGISDHSADVEHTLSAVQKGADIQEVHVCWDRRQFGPDVCYSLTIDELARLAKEIR